MGSSNRSKITYDSLAPASIPLAAGHSVSGSPLYALKEDNQMDPTLVLKPLDTGELETYRRLATSVPGDPIRKFTPVWRGVFEVVPEGAPEGEAATEPEPVNGKKAKDGKDSKDSLRYLCLGNLLHGLRRPVCVMDVKIGTRSFQEAEAQNTTLRKDLFEKMVKKFPDLLTDEDREVQAISKLKYLTIRDMESTTKSLGFRVDGIGGLPESSLPASALAKVGTHDDVCRVLKEFARHAAGGRSETGDCSNRDPLDIAIGLRADLTHLRAAFEDSPFVQREELIGTSVLHVADAAGACKVFWIDFAKAKALPQGDTASHRDPWVPNNHADGVLSGMDNLIAAWDDIVQSL